MEARDFAAILRAEGFAEAIPRRLPAGLETPVHTHEFDAKVLVTAGAFTLTRDGIATTHRPGDLFSVPMGHPHAERAGPGGAEYLAGRRQVTG
jgi:quercetin dioxygenase-like cupin family protein